MQREGRAMRVEPDDPPASELDAAVEDKDAAWDDDLPVLRLPFGRRAVAGPARPPPVLPLDGLLGRWGRIALYGLLGALYLCGFVFAPGDGAWTLLLTAAPTLPVLLLFALFVPDVLAVRRGASAWWALDVAALIATVIFLSASVLGLASIVVSALLGGVAACIMLGGRALPRLGLSVVIAVLVTPETGAGVMFCYDHLTQLPARQPALFVSAPNVALLGLAALILEARPWPALRVPALCVEGLVVAGTLLSVWGYASGLPGVCA